MAVRHLRIPHASFPSAPVFFNTIFDLLQQRCFLELKSARIPCVCGGSGEMACNNSGHILPLKRALVGKL